VNFYDFIKKKLGQQTKPASQRTLKFPMQILFKNPLSHGFPSSFCIHGGFGGGKPPWMIIFLGSKHFRFSRLVL